MANPPFAGDIKETRLLGKYELGKNDKGNIQNKVGRDILFIERNLDFLKPGGRMAVVLPQGRFNNGSDKYIREYIAERCRILAVVGLHGNTFKPHTGTKTSVLFLQKWDETLCPKKEDYNIFFATQQKPAKDNSGKKIYIQQDYVTVTDIRELKDKGVISKTYTKEEFIDKFGSVEEATIYYCNATQTMVNGKQYEEMPEDLRRTCDKKVRCEEFTKRVLDPHGHLVVDHDLYKLSYKEGEEIITLEDGIAEAFAEFAKKEGLSFFQ